jgi:hypothetical protein
MTGFGTNMEAARKQTNKMVMVRRPLKVESPVKTGQWGVDEEMIVRRCNADEEKAPLHHHRRHFVKKLFRGEKKVDCLEPSLYFHHQLY